MRIEFLQQKAPPQRLWITECLCQSLLRIQFWKGEIIGLEHGATTNDFSRISPRTGRSESKTNLGQKCFAFFFFLATKRGLKTKVLYTWKYKSYRYVQNGIFKLLKIISNDKIINHKSLGVIWHTTGNEFKELSDIAKHNYFYSSIYKNKNS